MAVDTDAYIAGVAPILFILFAITPLKGDFVLYILPGMILLGVGAGLGFNPVLLAAMDGIKPSDSGARSGEYAIYDGRRVKACNTRQRGSSPYLTTCT